MRYRRAITDSDVIDGLSVRYLKIFGVWHAINKYRTTGKKSTLITCQVIITLIYFAPYVIFQCLSFFVVKFDIQKASFMVLNPLIGFQICSQLVVFWLRIDIICKLYSLVTKDFLGVVSESKREEVKEIFLKITKKCNMVCVTVLITVASTGFMIVAYPKMPIEYIAHHTGDMTKVTGGKKKILSGWYPVPMEESPYYEVIYVYEAVGMIWGGTLLISYVCLFYQMLLCMYSQFTVLGFYMATLKSDSEKTVKSKSDNNDDKRDSPMYMQLYATLLEHQTLLSYTDELRSLFNPLVTMILGMGIFLMTVSTFQFKSARGISMVIASFQYVVAEGVQICMFCYGSSAIETASSELRLAIYCSDWYRADVKFRNAAQMVMLRARKGETLTAIKMYPVNVETIMAIFQFTYSLSALMSRTTE